MSDITDQQMESIINKYYQIQLCIAFSNGVVFRCAFRVFSAMSRRLLKTIFVVGRCCGKITSVSDVESILNFS